MATRIAYQHFLLLLLFLRDLSSGKVFKEDCNTLSDEVNQESISKLTSIKIPPEDPIDLFQCGSLFQIMQSTCELASKNEIASTSFYLTCEMAHQAIHFFQSIGLAYKKHEYQTGCFGGYDKATVRSNLHDSIRFIKDMMIILSGIKIVIITDIKPILVRRELERQLLSAKIVSPDITFNLTRKNYKGVNFFVLCTPKNTQNLLKKAKESKLLIMAQSWIILTDTTKETLLRDIEIPFSAHVAIATTSNSNDAIVPHNAALLWIPSDQKSISCSNIDNSKILNQNKEVGQFTPKALSLELYEVYSIQSGESVQYSEIGSWFNMNKRLRLKNTFPNMLRKLDGVHIRVVTIYAPPYVTFKKGKEPTNETLEGFYGQLLKTLAKEMNFTFSLKVEKAYGVKNNKGNWNGLFRALQDEDADVALADLSVTRDRKEVAEFSTKISSGTLRMIYKIPDEKYHFRLYIIPFGWEIWILVTASIIVSGVLLYITNRISPNSALQTTSDPVQLTKVKDQFGLFDCFLAVYNGFNQQGTELEPREVSGKIIFVTVYLSFVIIFSSYTSVFTSFLTIQENKKLFESLEDVYKDKSYKIGVIRDTNNVDIFKDETDKSNINYKIWQRIADDSENLVDDTRSGLNLAYTQNYVFLNPKESSTYYLGNNCSFDISSEDLFTDSYHMAYKKGFLYAETFNKYIDKLVEGGIIARLYSAYQRDKINFCSSDSVKPLGFKKVVSLYLLLAGASLFAAAALGVEWLFRLTESKKSKIRVQELTRPEIERIKSIKELPTHSSSFSNNSFPYKSYYFS